MRTILFCSAMVLSLAGVAVAQEAATPAEGGEAPPAAAGAAPATGQPAIRLELNKLEPAAGGCHVYFVVENQTGDEVGELQTDVYLFDRQQTVLRGLVLQFAGIAPQRTKVVPFELADLGCDAIGRVLLNQVVACNRPDASPLQGCAGRIAVSSRANVEFSY